MRQQRKLYLLALSFTLAATANLLADGPTFTPIDFPGAASTQAWGINTSGDIVGIYTLADKSTHGFLLSGGNTPRSISPALPASHSMGSTHPA